MSRLPITNQLGRSLGLPLWLAVAAPSGGLSRLPRLWTAALSPARSRAIGHGLILGGMLISGYIFLVLAPATGTFGYDSFAYWNVAAADPYGVTLGALGSFNYSPPALLVADFFGSMHWWAFAFLWTALLVGTIVWLGGSTMWILAALAFPPVALELYHGNIHLLLAAAVVLGFRHPWTWSFVLLTKFTSAVGLLWFVVRGEWRSLGIALGSTAAVCAVTLVLAPGLWADWIAYVSNAPQVVSGSSAVPIPLWLRLLAGATIVIWGARTDRRWTVIVAATLALPVLWIAGFAMLVGIVPELRGRSLSGRGDEATRAEVTGTAR